ncbi:DUF2829 domain-containing protein [Dactylosporangium sp. CS-033363]|uniref:DUF2829 domain-containing protein n=1 Tax=Dactylosporangium sp. CS-033363 TaxID=3239935 RepID=UPI003D90B4BF
MDFSSALVAVKNGAKITRTGWNGAGQYVVFQAGYPDGIAINANTAAATGLAEGTVCSFRPYLMFCTADGQFVPWVASQTDLLADDWEAHELSPARGIPGSTPSSGAARSVAMHVLGPGGIASQVLGSGSVNVLGGRRGGPDAGDVALAAAIRSAATVRRGMRA